MLHCHRAQAAQLCSRFASLDPAPTAKGGQPQTAAGRRMVVVPLACH